VRRALLGAVLLALAAVPGAEAARVVLFPTPLTQISSIPPFAPPSTALPDLYRPPVTSHEVIRVGIDRNGEVVSVNATQRLVLRTTGDYRLTVPAPVKNVVPAPGSESTPGLRTGAVLWAGFSSGHKVLAANATLEPAAAARVLPMRISATGGSVRLENATTTTYTTFTAHGDPTQLAQVLDALRKDPQGRQLGQGSYVKVTGPVRDLRVRLYAPLEVRGRIGGREVSLLLGSEPRTIRVTGKAVVDLSVEPVPPASLRESARKPDWNATLRTSLTLARVRQYLSFLVNPDPLGPLQARYLYRTVAAPGPPPAPPAPQDEGLAAWLIALIAAGSVAAVGGLAVIWANS
jgi:hypothetical protein